MNGNYIVNGDDLAIAYANLLNFTNVQLTMGGENKTLLVADVSFKNVSSQSATMKMTTSAATPSNPSCEIENDDYWYPVMGDGKCGAYGGQNSGDDASTRINYLLNDCYDYDCESGIVFFLNVVTKYEIFDEDHLWTGQFSDCLSPSIMHDDLDGAWYVINDNAPPNKDYISCSFSWDVITGVQYVHYFPNIKYGIIRCIEQ